MSKLFKFLILLIVFSLPLFWLWHTGGQKYYAVVLASEIALPLARGLNETPLQMNYIAAHYMNLVPLIALIFAVPALGWKKRLTALGLGLILTLIWHVVFTLVLNHFLHSLGGPSREFYRIYIPAISINSAMPVIIWAAVAWKGVRELAREIFVRPPSAPGGTQPA
jgi:hypothetical protein